MGIKLIAQMTGLSTATVSHALNGTRAVSAASREKVLQAAKLIGYRPNKAARMLRTQKSNTIAIIIPNDLKNVNANYFYMDVMMGVRKKVFETQYELIVSSYDPYDSADRSLPAAQVLRQHWVDGVIVVPSSRSQKQIRAIEELELPYVLLDRKSDSKSCCVTSDNKGGVMQAMQLFKDCGKKRIGFIGGSNSETGRQRYAGYLEALAMLKLPRCDELIRLCTHYSLEKGSLCAGKLLNADIDAVFVADNVMMMGALRELKARQVRIPEDIGLIGFDDFVWMEMVTPPLTTVKQQSFQMGYLAAEMLINKLLGNDVTDTVYLSTELVVRSSHG